MSGCYLTPSWSASLRGFGLHMAEKLRERLEGHPLRIAFPFNELPMIATEPEACSGGPNCTITGAYFTFVTDILREANVQWTPVAVSPVSTTAYPDSSFDACVYEVGIGGADLCIGPFWYVPLLSTYTTQ